MRLLATKEEAVEEEVRAGRRNETNRERNGDTSRGIRDSEKKRNRAKKMRARNKKRERDTEGAARNKTSRGVALALSGG